VFGREKPTTIIFKNGCVRVAPVICTTTTEHQDFSVKNGENGMHEGLRREELFPGVAG